MFRLKSCLCCFSLEGGAKFIGWMNFVGHIIMLAGITLSVFFPENNEKEEEHEEQRDHEDNKYESYKLSFGYSVIFFIYSAISVYCARQLINGVNEHDVLKVRVFTRFRMVGLGIAVFGALVVAFLQIPMKLLLMPSGVWNMYELLVSYSLEKSYEEL